ncbi:BTAD domain-containing putative transcriptional regulator [Streptomyces sp. NPDC051219]|uniref:AfsR/SARP family transcriptional regulator n=1 Tax=Streptomyces sp. NPDC051219 TaxID=3155283 RepID=UPI0034371D1C
MGPVRYGILGTTQALRDDGTAAPLGGARLRALLTALALRPGRTVPAGLLVDDVWTGDPPADAAGALQALIGRLRRALGHEAVTSAEGGYRLAAGPDDVDLHRFERLAGEAAQALDGGEPGKAVALLDDALALWRGPALADLPDRTTDAARWEARRLDARRCRFSAVLALGGAEQVLPELTALCADRPLDEPLHALRIRALREAGRTAEALEAYEEVRAAVAGRLGADPSPELRALHAELLAPMPLPLPGGGNGPARGRGGGAVRRAGLAPAGQAAGSGRAEGGAAAAPAGSPEAASASPGRASGAAPSGNLRARLTTFVGREADIEAIAADLGGARLVTLLGPGGAGKTRLSQEAAEAVADRWPDGVWLAELAPVDDPENVPEAVLSALGARETVLRGAGAEELRAVADRHGDEAVVRLTEHCARRQMLLLLDNCEHVVDAAARLADELLAHCPGLQILATSREPLGVPGEAVRPVEPLPDPMALRLFADRGASARPGFRIDDDAVTAAAAAEICRRLDGLPLAIELAAARLRMLTPRQIADRLDDRFRLLSSGSRTVLPRQQTLRAVVDWSWDLLDASERAVLRRLSVFAGGCDLSAAEEVCALAPLMTGGPAPGDGAGAGPGRAGAGPRVGGGAGTGTGSGPGNSPSSGPGDPAQPVVDPLDVASLLGSLVDKSLVVATPSGGGEMRYRLLETVAEYAAERLDEAGDRRAAERRHLVHYRELARTTDPLLRGREQRAAAARLEVEYENLRSALRRAVAARDEQETMCLLLSLSWYWHMRDLRTEARHWSEAAVTLGPDPFAPPVTPAPPLLERCTDAPPPMSPELLQEARRSARLIQMASRDQAYEHWHAPATAALIEGVLTAYRPGLPQTCRNPGSLWIYAVMLSGDTDRLRRAIDETVGACRELGYTWELAAALQLRANVLANRTEWAGDAERDAEESLALYRRLGDDWGEAEALSARGEARERRGEFARAAADFRASVECAQRLGAQAQVSLLRVRLAGVLAESGEGDEGEVILRKTLAEGARSGHEAVPAARIYLAMWLGRTSRTEEARRQLQLLRDEFAYGAFAVFDGIVLGLLAWLDNRDGRYGEALEKAREALERSKDPLARMVAPHMAAMYLMSAAGSLAALGGERRVRDAARLLGAQRTHLPAGHFETSLERENRAWAEDAARAALGDAVFEAAHAEGGGLSMEEATALV